MADYYLSGVSATGERLVIAPITSEVAAAHDMKESESLGYFLYQKIDTSEKSDVSILAKLPSEEAAFELGRLLGLN